MKAEYYWYALYLFVLLVALFAVVGFIWRRFFGMGERRARMEEELREAAQARSHEKEERLFGLYQHIEELMDSFEEYVNETRTAMQADRQTIGEQLAEARAILEELRLQPASEPAMAIEPEPEPEPIAPPSARAGNPRHEAVRALMAQGLGEQQIASELDISINEVRLIAYGLSRQ